MFNIEWRLFVKACASNRPHHSTLSTLNFCVKQRLDQLLVGRGLYASREKAQRAIMAGGGTGNERIVDKPGTRIAEDAVVSVKAPPRFVSRGGLKLEAALAAFAIDPAGRT